MLMSIVHKTVILFLQTGLTALDLAKTQDIRALLQEQFTKEEAKLVNQQQDTESQVKVESHQEEKQIDPQVNKEFTDVGEPGVPLYFCF